MNDGGKARQVAYTVRGDAGNVGAAEVRAAAGKLGNAIRTKVWADQTEALTVKLAAVLPAAMGAVTRVLSSAVTEQPCVAAPVVNRQQMQAIVEQMRRLLAESDATVVEYLGADGAVLRGLFGPEAYLRFEQCITSYAFDDALGGLSRALKDKEV